MVDRRDVLKLGAASVVGALAHVPIFGKSPSQYQRAVFDERFEPCRAFAAGLASAGVPTSAIRGDVAKLWYEDLRAALRKERAPVAGMTDRAALFCLEELARDVDMRVVRRVDHLMEPDVEHVIAQLFSRFDTREPRDETALKRTGPFVPENKTALVSWVIA